MAVSGPVAGFQKPGAEQAALDYLTEDPFDLNPIARSDAVWSHEHKPATECEDEVLKNHGETSSSETYDGRHLLRHAEHCQQNEQKPNGLCTQAQNGAQCLFL